MAGSTQNPRPDALINASDGRTYWEGINADVDGMLGGFASISRVDLQGSRTFLARLGIGLKNSRTPITRALEGGAGIGRVTEGLLIPISDRVDVVEPIAKFTAALRDKPGVGDVFNIGLEEWRPAEGVQYDLIWCQWCVGHLTDEQLVHFLKRCTTVLTPTSGVIVLKENMSTTNDDIFDEIDSSVTRKDENFQLLFEQAGLKIVRTDIQRGFPGNLTQQLFPVRMYALKPDGGSSK